MPGIGGVSVMPVTYTRASIPLSLAIGSRSFLGGCGSPGSKLLRRERQGSAFNRYTPSLGTDGSEKMALGRFPGIITAENQDTECIT